MIADLVWESLHQRRVNAKLVMVYRIVYGLIDIPWYPICTQLHWKPEATRYVTWSPTAERIFTGAPTSLQPSDCGTNCRKALWLPQPLKPSGWGWPARINYIQTVFILLLTCTFITKTCLYNFDPLKPHFYIVKLGFTGVYIIFLISAQKHRLWVLVRTASPQKYEKYQSFLSEIFSFFW